GVRDRCATFAVREIEGGPQNGEHPICSRSPAVLFPISAPALAEPLFNSGAGTYSRRSGGKRMMPSADLRFCQSLDFDGTKGRNDMRLGLFAIGRNTLVAAALAVGKIVAKRSSDRVRPGRDEFAGSLALLDGEELPRLLLRLRKGQVVVGEI